jgi:hypothetical protein
MEIREIEHALNQTEFRDQFEIKQHWAVRVTDLQGLLLRHQPDIVHFSGHGSDASVIMLEDAYGESHPVTVRALSNLFSVLKDNVRCVMLNACYSEQQAQAIAEHIDCVVGMSKAIGDKAAISFAAAFYQALGYGRDVKTAFDLGCVQIDLENLYEQDTPKLLAVRAKPEEIAFVRGGLKLENKLAGLDEKQQSKIEYRKERIEGWREAIEDFDFENKWFGDTVWYSEIRLYLKQDIVKRIEAPRTLIVPAEGRGEHAVKYILLDEIARLEREWDLI